MKFYLLFGPPGAGKGTQAKLLSEKFNLKHISTGEYLRNEIRKSSELGKSAKGIIDKGRLIDDETMISVIKTEINNSQNIDGFLFDGFPRTIPQAIALDEILREKNNEIESLISIMIEDNIIFDRLKNRAEIENRKDDADPKIINHRIETYHLKTEPLIEYYKKQNKYKEVDGSGSLENIFKTICTILK